MTIIPKTKLGKWSSGLIVVMPLLFIIGGILSSSLYQNVPAGNSIAEDVSARPVLALSMLSAMICGVSAFAAALIAAIKQKERAILIYLPIIIGALLLIFLLGELIAPH